ncbi:MAG: UPF0365 family protein, partial [Chitinivibrionales bacterium]|nr:UPF0365 family protein [Chitinivibrionales bacterium]MBD3355656.1 UPF0365 family protein [Chitinivibrionales bacterium]
MQFTVVLVVLAVILLLVLFFFVFSSLSLWFQSLVSGAQVGLFNIVFMRFRKVPPK